MNPVEGGLEEAKKLLIDLSLKNRLLNFKPTKKRTIEIVDTAILDVYQNLVLNEKPLLFASSDKGQNPNKKNEVALTNTSAADAAKLRTGYAEDDLKARLSYVYREANTIIEEQGYNGFFLALYFLTWTENASCQQNWTAPLVLVPVELKRIAAGRFELVWTKEDVQGNYSLQAKFEEQSLSLPDFEMTDRGTYLDNYISKIKKKISDPQGWKVELTFRISSDGFEAFFIDASWCGLGEDRG